MQSSEAYLERALAEFNHRVALYEEGPPSVELVDALQKRGRILALMGYGVSSAEDFDDAVETLDSLIEDCAEVPPDLCLRTYASAGMACRDDEAAMKDYYRMASGYIQDLTDPASCARVCLECAEDLIEIEDYGDAVPFVEAAMATRDSNEKGARNLYLSALNLYAEVLFSQERFTQAARYLNEAVKTGAELFDRGELYDNAAYVYSYLNLCDCLLDLRDNESLRMNLDTLSALIDEKEISEHIRPEELAEIHGRIGRMYMEIGQVSVAEKHLLRQAAFSLGGTDSMLRDAIENRMNDGNGE